MSDLISRQAAIDAICKACANGDDFTKCRDRELKTSWCDNIVALRDLPSAQPEHIQCRDCKHCTFNAGAKIYCDELDMRLYQWDYCSRAERREE